ncbi:MAG: bifunctional folylpolyglutamate synthase/dihydrofolate synthase [Nitrospinae bacterium]|nr:bifunctional folylpolyglutamate synthase/dihydrofolate synthase [Nitrospinota bacterium]
MDYKKAQAYLDSLSFRGMKLGLANTSALLSALGDPHLAVKTVHVGGTNGKGSTSAMVASIVSLAGIKCGLYVSPHLQTFRERISVDGEMITKPQAARLVGRVKEAAEKMADPVTYFEFMTAMAFLHFAEEKVGLAVMEVGMGGRFDSTNVTTPEVTVITSVAMDHRQHLGGSLEKIAAEKCGIIKPGAPVVTAVRQPHVVGVALAAAEGRRAPVSLLGRDFHCRRTGFFEGGERFYFRSGATVFKEATVSLVGRQQILNASMAIQVALLLRERGYRIDDRSIIAALGSISCPGRFEMVSEKPAIILDGAHNPRACSVLRETLLERFGAGRVDFVFGAMADKEFKRMIRNLLPVAASFTFFSPSVPRAADPQIFQRALKNSGAKVPSRVIGPVDELMGWIGSRKPERVILVTGSFYTVGEIRAKLSGGKVEDRA